jgi:hypothetical protein
MKIVITVVACGDAAHIGGGVERISGIVETPDEKLPECYLRYLKNKQWASEGEHRYTYESVELSILEETP